MTPQARWQPLLYGRTARADRWWRLRPYDVKIDWLNAVVVACTGGGEGLADHARFLLARRGPLLLVGVASRASALSDTMNSDGSRPFYTFVGWITRDGQALPPNWDTLVTGWNGWSTEVYQAWMPLDWNKHRTDLGDGHESPFLDAPWAAAPGAVSGSAADSPERAVPPTREGTILIPADQAPKMWSALSAAAFDFAFVAGFDRPPANGKGVLTHASVASIEVPAVQRPGELPPERTPARERQEPATYPPEVPARQSMENTQPPGRPSYAEKGPGQEGGYRGPSREQSQRDKESRTWHHESQGGLLNRAKRFINPHPDEDVPSDESRHPEEEPQFGPMKDLDYWAKREKPKRPRPGESAKQLPPEDEI